MKKPAGLSIPSLIAEARGEDLPGSGQVYRGIREVILSGATPAGQRLPSARVLPSDIRASRTTVEAAQLWAEGFIVRRTRSR